MIRSARLWVALAFGCAAVVVLGAAPAVAGGGCHDPVTTAADARGQAETTVDMKGACFWPTTVFVDPGTSVTFASYDAGIVHNVGGLGWGHFEDMERGDAFRATFDEVGTYPYACSYHPGMTGAIVVGNGRGEPDGGWVSIEPFAQPEPAVVTKTVRESPSPASTIGAGAAGVALGGAIAWAVARRR
jgi:plastocyanin